jgi:SAM-dependent methyltransferase
VGGSLAVAAASATALPFADGSFDAAFSAYGAIPFVADLPALFAEAHRVLRPGAPWVCSVTHPIRWAFPDDPGPAGLTATMSYFDRLPYVERVPSGQAVYAEFHRTIGDYVAALRAAGFTIEAMIEPEWPDWNDQTWNGWSPLRGTLLPGTLILSCLAQ